MTAGSVFPQDVLPDDPHRRGWGPGTGTEQGRGANRMSALPGDCGEVSSRSERRPSCSWGAAQPMEAISL